MADGNGRILVTGACGQIGSELTIALREAVGGDNVVAAGHVKEPSATLRESGPFEFVDVRDHAALDRLVDRFDVDKIYHMAAILSAAGEKDPWRAWDVNVNGLLNVLEIARERGLSQVFAPSSIAVFGPDVPRDLAPQDAPLNPRTMYGITKLAGEALARHYALTFGLDVRGLRYPGIISSETMPGGGTTDYAVEIFYAADSSGHYQCFVREDTVLPMMYMPDCIRATLDLMNAPRELLSCAEGYNVAGMSFSAGDLAMMIQRECPGFTCSFVPDERQAIADSWPMRIDDRAAQRDWNWRASYGLEKMVSDMLERIWRVEAKAPQRSAS
jgi:nucleoside-diphosphate-sugar epimerase